MLYDDVPMADGGIPTDGGMADGGATTPADGGDTEEKDGESAGETV